MVVFSLRDRILIRPEKMKLGHGVVSRFTLGAVVTTGQYGGREVLDGMTRTGF